jgi:hypothetical protein
MTNYTKATDFAAKDALVTGNPAKLVKGTEIDDEFTLIEAAISSKANSAAPTFTGTAVGASLTLSNNLTVGGTFTGTIDGGTY